MEIDWTTQLLDQLGFQWDTALRPRLDTLTDEAFHWEPVAGMWGLRRRADAVSSMPQGAGDVVMDFDPHRAASFARSGTRSAHHAPPPPVTTIAWRLAHIAVVYGERTANHFGEGGVTHGTMDWPLDVAGMLALIDHWHAGWIAGVASLDAAGLARPCGPAEGPYAAEPLAALVLHINREILHHGAEVALLMDLYAHRDSLRGAR